MGRRTPVSAVYDEFAENLARWSRRYAGQPQREMLRLLFLGLEREEVVSVGYRETLIAQRLETMPLTKEVKDLILHALVWAWKDEQMHAIYLRGAILRYGDRRLRIWAFARQMIGFLGGWAGSVRQHRRWRDAPISHTVASLITALGGIAGVIPRDVREYLRFRPFRDFCIFNIDAEKTAALCYERMIALLPALENVPPRLGSELERVWEDEKSHTRIFELFAKSLDETDHLKPGVTFDWLREQVADVGENFLPRGMRRIESERPTDHCHVYVRHGNREQKLDEFRALLDEVGMRELVQQRVELLGVPADRLRIVVKAAFMMGYHRRDMSVVVDPVLIEALADYLNKAGCRDITVVESANIYDRFYGRRTAQEVARYFGIESPLFRVEDLSQDLVEHTYGRGMAQYVVGRRWKEADIRISFAKMRSHTVEQVYLTVGNLDSVGARSDEFLFPERQAHRETAVMMLLSEFPPDLGLIDAYDTAADGILGMMGCTRPKSPYRLYAGRDLLAVDLTAAAQMGLDNPRRSNLLNTACHWFGDPSPEIEVHGEQSPIAHWRGPYSDEISMLLGLIAYPTYEFFSCRGALFVPEMDTVAFPPIKQPSLPMRIARAAMQRTLGLHHRPRRGVHTE